MRRLLAILAATAALAQAGMAQAQSGAALYQARCQGCHSGVIAPDLRGVMGRKAGTGHFASYSAALKGSGIVWTRPSLEKFLAAPTAVVPGTRMVIAVPDAAQRVALVDYLAGLN